MEILFAFRALCVCFFKKTKKTKKLLKWLFTQIESNYLPIWGKDNEVSKHKKEKQNPRFVY